MFSLLRVKKNAASDSKLIAEQARNEAVWRCRVSGTEYLFYRAPGPTSVGPGGMNRSRFPTETSNMS